MNSGKSIIFGLFKGVAIVAFTLFFTAWIAGSSDIEYKSKSIDSYFSVPEALKDKLKIMNGTTEIENISVVNFGLYNRNFSDYEKVNIYIEIQDDNPPKLISSNLLPPERLTKIGITELIDSEKKLIQYSIDVFKTSIDGDYYLVSLIFEGNEAPNVKISTNTKNVEIKKYKEWKDAIWLILIVSLVYGVLIILMSILVSYSTKRSKNRYLNTLKAKWAEEGFLNEEQLEHVIKTFIRERDRKNDGFFRNLKNKITSTE